MSEIKSSELPGKVGYQAEPTDWFTVTQEQINDFAENTRDRYFIHIDPERAAETPLGSTIAHGFLTLSMLSYFSNSFSLKLTDLVMGFNYGLDKVRFLAPVKTGSRIRAHATLTDVTEKKAKQYVVKYTVRIEIEGEETPALIADWLGMVICG